MKQSLTPERFGVLKPWLFGPKVCSVAKTSVSRVRRGRNGARARRPSVRPARFGSRFFFFFFEGPPLSGFKT